MPTFMCFLNWTDQAAKALKDAPKRYEATKALVAKLGGRLICGYVTTGQYDVALVTFPATCSAKPLRQRPDVPRTPVLHPRRDERC